MTTASVSAAPSSGPPASSSRVALNAAVVGDSVPFAVKRIATVLAVADILDGDCGRLRKMGARSRRKDSTSIDIDSDDWHVRAAVRHDSYRMILDSEPISNRACYQRRRRQQQQLQVSHADLSRNTQARWFAAVRRPR
jgi:hypothetical protein